MNIKIAVLDGDGIGKEITAAAVEVLEKIGKIYGHSFEFKHLLIGGAAIDETGEPLPEQTVLECKNSDSVLLGAVGGPKWETLPGHLRPEAGLLKIRGELGLFANIRPARLFEPLKDACPLRADIAEKGIDIVVVRELTGGIYFGERGRKVVNGQEAAYDTELYSVPEIERIAKVAFEIARGRKKKVISIDKANVLESSRLWRQTVHNLAKEYPDIEVTDMLVDNAAMQLVRNPSQFDVIVTSNIFGDILSDEAAMITGSIGMLASSSLGQGGRGLYEPVHGSAPDIAGKDLANPIATILSCAMMLRDSFKLFDEAQSIERAIDTVLAQGYRTADIYSGGKTKVSGSKMAQLILENLS